MSQGYYNENGFQYPENNNTWSQNLPQQTMYIPTNGQSVDTRQYNQETYVELPPLPDVLTFESEYDFSQPGLLSSQEEIGVPSIDRWVGDFNFAFALERGTTKKFAVS